MKKIILSVLFSSSLLLFTACGIETNPPNNNTPKNEPGSSKPDEQNPQTPAPNPNPETLPSHVSYPINEADWKVLAGSYTGTLKKSDGYETLEQPFTLKLAMDEQSNAFIEFDSQGPLGAINSKPFFSKINALPNWSNSYLSYAFTSNIIALPELSDAEVVFKLILSVQPSADGSRKFYPSRSSLSLGDCGFSMDIYCTNNVYDIQLYNLQKSN